MAWRMAQGIVLKVLKMVHGQWSRSLELLNKLDSPLRLKERLACDLIWIYVYMCYVCICMYIYIYMYICVRDI